MARQYGKPGEYKNPKWPRHRNKAEKLNPTERMSNAHPAEDIAEMMETTADPFKRVHSLLRESGMNHHATNMIIKRMRSKFPGASTAVKQITTKEILKKMDEKIAMGFDYMDEVAFSGASLRDLAIFYGIMIEKRQLLRGEPTQILSVEERKTLNESIPLIIKEAKRRGFVIDVNPTEASDEEGVSVRALPDLKNREEWAINKTDRKLHKERRKYNID